jgi:hypothetical protein
MNFKTNPTIITLGNAIENSNQIRLDGSLLGVSTSPGRVELLLFI